MGNRAYIVFDARWPKQKPKATDALPAVYLHWNGGPESIYAFLAYTKEVCREGDKEYIPARFVQIVGNYFGNNLSLGLTATLRKDIKKLASVGDNGCYVVDVDTYEVTERHFQDYIDIPEAPHNAPWNEGVTYRKVFRSLSKEEIAAEKAAAIVHDDDRFTNPSRVLEGLHEVNDPFFNKGYDQKVVVTLTAEDKAA